MSAGKNEFDVLIAGGGMVGASLALALAPSGWRIGLIEPSGLAVSSSPSFDERATALSWSSRRLFSALGLWPAIARGSEPIRHIHVSERHRFGRTRLHAEELRLDALGHVTPNRVLGQALSESLREQDNIELIAEAVRPELQRENARVHLYTESGRRLSGRLVVVADGAASRLRDALGIASRRVSFSHAAMVANLCVERAHQGWAYERFTTEGPLAMLPLPADEQGRHRVNMVMSLPRHMTRAWQEDAEAERLARIRERFGAHLGAFLSMSKPAVYPLMQVRAQRLHEQRVVLAGNAAMSLHPVAGQGFNLALRGVGDLAEGLLALAARDGDPGDHALLAAYAERRRADMDWTGAWTRGLVEGFTLGLPGVGRMRSASLLAMDRLPPARRWFTRQAMGMMPGLSRLSRGIESDS